MTRITMHRHVSWCKAIRKHGGSAAVTNFFLRISPGSESAAWNKARHTLNVLGGFEEFNKAIAGFSLNLEHIRR